MRASLEVELKYSATPGALAELLRTPRLGPARLGQPASREELDRYLDTAGGRLAAAGWACRLRSVDGRHTLSLKGPPLGDATGGLHRRRELEGPASAEARPLAWPASRARELLRALSCDEPLEERLALAQHRTERSVERDGRRVATLSLDEATVLSRGQAVSLLHVAECELVAESGEDESMWLAAALGAVPGLVPDPRSKLEHALELVGSGALPDR
ncbi:MAG TPA: CYTH domain-containing protein [Candidatus Limnocylindria bacterium]